MEAPVPAKSRTSKPAGFTDPHNEPVRSVDQVMFHRGSAAHLDLVCLTNVMKGAEGGKGIVERRVAARLRINLVLARQIVQSLNQQIAMAEASEGPKN